MFVADMISKLMLKNSVHILWNELFAFSWQYYEVKAGQKNEEHACAPITKRGRIRPKESSFFAIYIQIFFFMYSVSSPALYPLILLICIYSSRILVSLLPARYLVVGDITANCHPQKRNSNGARRRRRLLSARYPHQLTSGSSRAFTTEGPGCNTVIGQFRGLDVRINSWLMPERDEVDANGERPKKAEVKLCETTSLENIYTRAVLPQGLNAS